MVVLLLMVQRFRQALDKVQF